MCGRNGPFMIWQEHSDSFIFELVPGTSPMVEITEIVPGYGHGAVTP